jgi:hypothetical protein
VDSQVAWWKRASRKEEGGGPYFWGRTPRTTQVTRTRKLPPSLSPTDTHVTSCSPVPRIRSDCFRVHHWSRPQQRRRLENQSSHLVLLSHPRARSPKQQHPRHPAQVRLRRHDPRSALSSRPLARTRTSNKPHAGAESERARACARGRRRRRRRQKFAPRRRRPLCATNRLSPPQARPSHAPSDSHTFLDPPHLNPAKKQTTGPALPRKTRKDAAHPRHRRPRLHRSVFLKPFWGPFCAFHTQIHAHGALVASTPSPPPQPQPQTQNNNKQARTRSSRCSTRATRWPSSTT